MNKLQPDILGQSHRKMPRQKPGLSKQDYATPAEFIAAVKRRFGIKEFTYDLAASQENTKAKYFFCEEEDSLKQDWAAIVGDMWLNPPYSHIEPWAQKCTETAWYHSHKGPGPAGGRRIFFLVPASVGSNWYSQHVHNRALVLFLNRRISFDGVAPYPKDLLLAVYGMKPAIQIWRWKEQP